jgi:hypothetical protein
MNFELNEIGEKWMLMTFSGAELHIKMSNVVSKAKILAN